jgi:hypothetical protein
MKSRALLDACIDILSAMQPMTVRGVCYQLFTRRLIPDMSKNSTDRVSRLLTLAREDGLLPWAWIVDETRPIEGQPGWADPTSFLADVKRAYRRDRWAWQPRRVLVISEKATVGGVLRPVLDRFGVPFLINHGFGSATVVKDLAELIESDARPLTLLYAGDHDPSGRYMSDVDLPQRLAAYGGGRAGLVRLAVTIEQISAFGLPTFSAHEKQRDARYRWFLARHGETCAELDALNPNRLRELVSTAIEQRIDWDAWDRAEAVEAAEMQSLREFLASWPGAA